jgi:hypothetical protein
MLDRLERKDFIASAYAVYSMDDFGNDTDTPAIWEKLDSNLDLTPGDGATGSTFPTFTADTDHETAYYSFDGVDDYISDWPAMPAEYTVVAAMSSSYSDGQPEIQSCNDTTIETLLTTSGSFTGNLHCLLIFDWELSSEELLDCEQIMLRRLWRDTFVDPFTARKIREDICQLCLYCEEEADKFDDYSDNAIGSTDYSIGWNYGIYGLISASGLVMDSDSSINLDSLSIFIEAPNFDTEAAASGRTILQNGTNYILEISKSGDVGTVTFNSSSCTFAVNGNRTLCVTANDGEKPRFYINGSFIGEGNSVCTVSSAGAGQLTILNNTARNDAFASTLKKFSLYSEILTDAEIRAAHIMAMSTRQWTT